MAATEGWTIRRLLPFTTASAVRVTIAATLLVVHLVAGGNVGSFLFFAGAPVLLYVFALRSVVASVLCGAALVALHSWTADAYDDALESGSSTAALA